MFMVFGLTRPKIEHSCTVSVADTRFTLTTDREASLSFFLFQHGIDSTQPLKYTHLDIAGSEGSFPGIPTGSPVPALVNRHLGV